MLLRDTQLKTEHGGGGARVIWAACSSVALRSFARAAHGQAASRRLWRRVALRIKEQPHSGKQMRLLRLSAPFVGALARTLGSELSWRLSRWGVQRVAQ
jgi:hypothetical protein